ncbi:MAG: XrtA system polysaccharide deacetylase [Pseudomonadota bacterium]
MPTTPAAPPDQEIPDHQIHGAMTIDVEEYFHVSAFEGIIDRADWPQYESRVAASMAEMLDLFAETGRKGTFFVLGVVARDHPAIVRRLAAEGHEIASHGWEHRRVFHETRAEFRDEVARTKALLEDIGGQHVAGYRAPSFSITAATPWAYEVLGETGHRYSSSSNPITGNRYGCPEEPLTPYTVEGAGIVEIPITTLPFRGRRVAGGGGGYFRLLPPMVFRRAARHAAAEGVPPNFYLHPWEIDPGQPRIGGTRPAAGFRHYVGLSRTKRRLRRHLSTFAWDRMDHVYRDWLS